MGENVTGQKDLMSVLFALMRDRIREGTAGRRIHNITNFIKGFLLAANGKAHTRRRTNNAGAHTNAHTRARAHTQARTHTHARARALCSTTGTVARACERASGRACARPSVTRPHVHTHARAHNARELIVRSHAVGANAVGNNAPLCVSWLVDVGFIDM